MAASFLTLKLCFYSCLRWPLPLLLLLLPIRCDAAVSTGALLILFLFLVLAISLLVFIFVFTSLFVFLFYPIDNQLRSNKYEGNCEKGKVASLSWVLLLDKHTHVAATASMHVVRYCRCACVHRHFFYVSFVVVVVVGVWSSGQSSSFTCVIPIFWMDKHVRRIL